MVYTRALREEYPDGIELYSDIDSKINYQKVMAGYMVFVVAMTLFAGLLNLMTVLINWTNYGSLMSLNLICAVLMFALFIAATIAAIKAFVNIGKLKKERKLHE